ncbi:hypothetical protein L596_007934 [Steinernema carpocapsae]|uniref:MAU2 chromatid cohesion factor homolog n=1 Tax=Steinernema carpocapsae TaxID=34508 RepID=A0A4V6A667_STECR|nr:hypothetical protein L596_007934 [Steinernema carpocapsae]
MCLCEFIRPTWTLLGFIKIILVAALKTRLSRQLVAHCHYELGKLLKFYTKTTELAKFHLENAYNCMKDLGAPFEESRMKVVCLLAELYIDMGLYDSIKAFLRIEVEVSRKYPFLHYKILFLFAEVYARSGESERARSILEAGIAMCHQKGNHVMEAYFRCSRGLLMSMQGGNLQEVIQTVMEVERLVQQFSEEDQYAINNVKSFTYSVQLCHFIANGMIKNAKKTLRKLQETIQKTTENQYVHDKPHFRWLGTEALTALTYILTVISSMQLAQFERAVRYSKLAVKQVEDMRIVHMRVATLGGRRSEEILSNFEMIVYENMVQTTLILGKPTETLVYLGKMLEMFRANKDIVPNFAPQFHTLLGLYSVYMKLPQNASMQFCTALKMNQDRELFVFNNLSLALVYLMEGRDEEFNELFERITPSSLGTEATTLRSAAHFVQALYGYLHSRQQDCKTNITDCLTIARDEDLPRIQALATLLLSQLFESRDRECLKNAHDWTQKSNDHILVMWANYQIFAMQSGTGQLDLAEQTKRNLDHAQAQIDEQRKLAAAHPSHAVVNYLPVVRMGVREHRSTLFCGLGYEYELELVVEDLQNTCTIWIESGIENVTTVPKTI